MDSEDIVQNNADKRLERINHSEEIDSKYGFVRHRSTIEKIGWLVNFQPVCLKIHFLHIFFQNLET